MTQQRQPKGSPASKGGQFSSREQAATVSVGTPLSLAESATEEVEWKQYDKTQLAYIPNVGSSAVWQARNSTDWEWVCSAVWPNQKGKCATEQEAKDAAQVPLLEAARELGVLQ